MYCRPEDQYAETCLYGPYGRYAELNVSVSQLEDALKALQSKFGASWKMLPTESDVDYQAVGKLLAEVVAA